MRIYLDNCCYNRPFDEQTQLKVRLETITKLAVQLLMATHVVEYVWSKTLDYEISFNPFPKRRATVMWWKEWAAEYVETTEEIIRRGEEIERFGIKPKDALHLASAEKAHCDMFLTTEAVAKPSRLRTGQSPSLPNRLFRTAFAHLWEGRAPSRPGFAIASTDKGIFEKISTLGRMKIVTPVKFITEEYNGNL